MRAVDPLRDARGRHVTEGRRQLLGLGVKHESLAAGMGVDAACVSRIASGERLPTLRQAVALEALVGIPCRAWCERPAQVANPATALDSAATRAPYVAEAGRLWPAPAPPKDATMADRPNFPTSQPGIPAGDDKYLVPPIKRPADPGNVFDDAARRAGAPAGKWSEGIEKPTPAVYPKPATYSPEGGGQ
jgi:hypothetical protein